MKEREALSRLVRAWNLRNATQEAASKAYQALQDVQEKTPTTDGTVLLNVDGEMYSVSVRRSPAASAAMHPTDHTFIHIEKCRLLE